MFHHGRTEGFDASFMTCNKVSIGDQVVQFVLRGSVCMVNVSEARPCRMQNISAGVLETASDRYQAFAVIVDLVDCPR